MNPSTPPVAFLAPGHTSKADPSDVRRNNRALIFGLLFPATELSRAQIGRRTGLSRVAVSDVVGSMLDEGLIREGGLAHNPGKGKRGTLLGIDTQRLHIVSIDLSQSRFIQGAVTDLSTCRSRGSSRVRSPICWARYCTGPNWRWAPRTPSR